MFPFTFWIIMNMCVSMHINRVSLSSVYKRYNMTEIDAQWNMVTWCYHISGHLGTRCRRATDWILVNWIGFVHLEFKCVGSTVNMFFFNLSKFK